MQLNIFDQPAMQAIAYQGLPKVTDDNWGFAKKRYVTALFVDLLAIKYGRDEDYAGQTSDVATALLTYAF